MAAPNRAAAPCTIAWDTIYLRVEPGEVLPPLRIVWRHLDHTSNDFSALLERTKSIRFFPT